MSVLATAIDMIVAAVIIACAVAGVAVTGMLALAAVDWLERLRDNRRWTTRNDAAFRAHAEQSPDWHGDREDA